MSAAATPLDRALQLLAQGRSLERAEARGAFAELMSGRASAAAAAGLLLALRTRGETVEEVAGAVEALREAMIRVVPPDGMRVVDTCGTGGGRVPTFNISTAAALVAVAAGARVAKHGNRSYTSRCGSADVLEALGLDLTLEPPAAADLLARAGMVFLFAPAFHPAMRFVAPVRRELGVPTIMNLVGPLANPAGARRQVVGVADRDRAPVLAGALAQVGAEHALVVHAEVGMDEIAPAGLTHVWEVRDGQVAEWTLEPAVVGLEHEDLEALAGSGPEENAARIRRLVREPGADPAGRAAVALNAGAALYVAGVADSWQEGVRRAVTALDEGAALPVLDRLVTGGSASTAG